MARYHSPPGLPSAPSLDHRHQAAGLLRGCVFLATLTALVATIVLVPPRDAAAAGSAPGTALTEQAR